MATLLIQDASGLFVDTIPAERYAFLKWRKAWAKRTHFPTRNVAVAIAFEGETPTTMLVDTGAILSKLRPWLAEGQTQCELVARVPDREGFPEQEVWQPWSAASRVK